MKPYVHRFDEHTTWRLSEVCLKLERPGVEWMYKNLSEALEKYDKRKYYAPSLDEHIESLNHRPNNPYSMRDWFEAFTEDWRNKKAWQPGWEYILK